MTLWSITDIAVSNHFHQLVILNTDDHLVASSKANVFSSSDSGVAISANTWFRAGGVWASATSRTAWHDETKGTTDTASITPLSIDDTYIGAIKLAAGLFNPTSGRIAEVAVYNVALADDEMKAYARGVSPLRIRSGSLVYYVPIWGLNSPEPDYATVGSWALNSDVSDPVRANHASVIPYSRRFWGHGPLIEVAAVGGRIMSSLAYHGGLAGRGGIAGKGGGLAA